MPVVISAHTTSVTVMTVSNLIFIDCACSPCIYHPSRLTRPSDAPRSAATFFCRRLTRADHLCGPLGKTHGSRNSAACSVQLFLLSVPWPQGVEPLALCVPDEA